MADELDPPRLMVYEPRADGEWRHGFFLGAFRMEPTAADVAAWLAAQTPEAARSAVRAYLARDPEAAAKVAGAWERLDAEHSQRKAWGMGAIAKVQPHRGGFLWGTITGHEGYAKTRAEAEAVVDALLAADGWVLGEEVSRG